MTAVNHFYTFKFTLDWPLINLLSQIDRFDAEWSSLEKEEGQNLRFLKRIATVRSVGASTRIEGSRMTDDEVDALLKHLSVEKLEERDQQEVAGYYSVLDTISESYADITVTESNIKMLHNMLMKYSEKDTWHRGDYKQHSNVVEATRPDGSKYKIFDTTTPGFATEDAMAALVRWYESDNAPHALVKTAVFVYDFLSIHPFQDGNGRLSRLLSTLLLLKTGYTWIPYVSFEHEIESRKAEYYKVLMDCQQQRPGEDVYPWVKFFFDCLIRIQGQLKEKLRVQNSVVSLPSRDRKIFAFVEAHPGAQSGEIATALNIPLPSIKVALASLVRSQVIQKTGVGKATRYVIRPMNKVQRGLQFTLSATHRKKVFIFSHFGQFIELKKLIVRPSFEWKDPNEWSAKLIQQNTGFIANVRSASGKTEGFPFVSFSSMISPQHVQPVFALALPIMMPEPGWATQAGDYPLEVEVEVTGGNLANEFEVDFYYDGSIE